jgi:mono/diheme cytochrome c family protein
LLRLVFLHRHVQLSFRVISLTPAGLIQAGHLKSDSAFIDFISEGKGLMPSFKTELSQQQLSDAVHYIRVLASNKTKQR